ncbi:hypothetical protein SSX86_010133 [Deinandra increscens subsp. villosa]|uniref:Avr9/Cf-9 rapidly elicited protein 146 n=1 Tax=Deinandra increscens subsp. villosa TaxID=3103831 RepID=A0AAP0D7G0_9ASTR
MEQNLPITAKKVWSLMRVIFFMLKKGISKAKLLTDLTMLTTRGKLAGKSLHNLLFHHHHHWAAATFPPPISGEYEFSCTTTPTYPLSLFSSHKKNRGPHTPPLDDIFINAAVMRALEDVMKSAAASPEVGKSTPVGRELRVTDSPFPLSNGDGDGKVDEAADRFIMRFYKDLRSQ